MGKIVNFSDYSNKEPSPSLLEHVGVDMGQLIDAVLENGLDKYIDVSILQKDMANMTPDEQVSHLKDLYFEFMSLENHWAGEQKVHMRKQLEGDIDNELQVLSAETDCELEFLYSDRDKLSESDRNKAGQLLESHPDDASTIDGVIQYFSKNPI